MERGTRSDAIVVPTERVPVIGETEYGGDQEAANVSTVVKPEELGKVLGRRKVVSVPLRAGVFSPAMMWAEGRPIGALTIRCTSTFSSSFASPRGAQRQMHFTNPPQLYRDQLIERANPRIILTELGGPKVAAVSPETLFFMSVAPQQRFFSHEWTTLLFVPDRWTVLHMVLAKLNDTCRVLCLDAVSLQDGGMARMLADPEFSSLAIFSAVPGHHPAVEIRPS